MRSATGRAVWLVVLALLVACRAPRDAEPAAAVEARGEVAQGPERPVHVMSVPGPTSFMELTDEVGHAVVNLRTTSEVTGGPASIYPGARPDSSLGSGFVVDREERLVLTAHHIVADARALRVVVAGEERGAEIVGRAPHLDLALVRIEGAPLSEEIPALRVVDSERLRVGEWVLALGNPFGGEVTASAGIVSSVSAASHAHEVPAEQLRALIHTDAAIHRGNAGGPLINLAGEVVGVNTVMGRGTPVGLAIPSGQVLRVMAELRRGHVAESWLGVFVLPVRPERAEACGTRGAEVTQILPAGPAEKAGLQAGDVLVRVDGKDIDVMRLAAIMRATVAGQQLTLTLCRDGDELTRVIVAEEKPR